MTWSASAADAAAGPGNRYFVAAAKEADSEWEGSIPTTIHRSPEAGRPFGEFRPFVDVSPFDDYRPFHEFSPFDDFRPFDVDRP
jgi:hypothetical protein